MVNSHPLTGLGSKAIKALTPNHFVKGPELPAERISTTNENESLRDLYKHSQVLADRLWERWIAELVSVINQRTKGHGEAHAHQPERSGIYSK